MKKMLEKFIESKIKQTQTKAQAPYRLAKEISSNYMSVKIAKKIINLINTIENLN